MSKRPEASEYVLSLTPGCSQLIVCAGVSAAFVGALSPRSVREEDEGLEARSTGGHLHARSFSLRREKTI
jgi:hypothetical protein